MAGLIVEAKQRGTTSRQWRNLPYHVFELATAIVFGLVAVAWIVDPVQTGRRSPVGGEVVGTIYPWVWSIGYLIALPLVAYGIARSNAVRVAGLWVLGMALTMQFVAALTSPVIGPRTFSYAVFAIAALVRSLLLVKLTPRR